jgi:hypothetical protein
LGWQIKDGDVFTSLDAQEREQKGGQRFLERIKTAPSSI